jgi:hypothetical protein
VSADKIAEIRPALRDAIDGAPDTCVTLSVAGDSTKWVQIVARMVNAAYPHYSDPAERAKTLPALSWKSQVVNWESGKFATFEFEKLEPTSLAHWIEAYFVTVLDCVPGQYHIDITCEEL